jgi:hypothetical protein
MLDVEHRSGSCLQYSCREDVQFKKSISAYRFALNGYINDLMTEWRKNEE